MNKKFKQVIRVNPKVITLLTAVLIVLSAHKTTPLVGSDNVQKCNPPQKQQHEVVHTNVNGQGVELQIIFTRGKAHNHPLMAVWIEDTLGKYLQTLYVSESIAKSYFAHGQAERGKWMPGVQRRPAALPYWAHKRGIIAADGLYKPSPEMPVPDAYTGATPVGNFTLNTRADSILPDTFMILFEINQSWDWNSHWTNNKFPDDDEYKTSSQPAVVYAALVNLGKESGETELKPIGHSHYSGKSGELFTNLNTLTTALHIAGKIVLRIP